MKNLFSKSFTNKQTIIIAAALFVAAASIGIIYNSTKKTVAVTLDGKRKVVKTHAATINEMLKDLEITVHAEDSVYPKADTRVEENLKITIQSAKKADIIQDGHKKTVWTTGRTVRDILKQENIKVNSKDKISPSLNSAIINGIVVNVQKAFPVAIVVAGKKSEVWSTSTTVADFLEQQNIKLNDLDRIEPGLNEHIKPGKMVKVVRVEKVTDVVEEPVNFAVVTKKDASLRRGTEKILTEGRKGLISRQYEVIRENGKEKSRKLVTQKTVKQKRNKIVAVGTKILTAQASRGRQEQGPSGGREIYVNSTAYTASCSGCSGFTSTGINLKSNPNSKVIAVDPSVIPLGSKVYVEGYGYAVAADKGGAIKGYKIDVFFPSTADAYKWGVRKIKIRILN
ncbi:ubiquitin-like domain-containing protein [Peribacillus sp. SCS-37]|uniref:ubiquitin-like domain-containing protein n=1 Tax=Paraperibacillus esterisolvens TaxID=3115296 RepID=UPI0039063389